MKAISKLCILSILCAAAAPMSGQVKFQDLRNGLKDPTRWLQYSGDFAAQRYSPLTQLTPGNVSRLVPQWTFQTDLSPFMSTGRSGGMQSVPLVLDGVLYLAGPHNVVWAIDARSGRQIWQYRRNMPNDVPSVTGRGATRGLSVLGDRLFLGTLDAHMVALDIKTGKVVWDTVMADYKKFYSVTSAPLVIGENKIAVGIGGGDRAPDRFFVDAYDTRNGNRLWRWYTTPEAGAPGSESWPSAEAMARGGGATWTIGSYDPELNLVFWGTGNPNGAVDARLGDNLYTSSLVALDGDTGNLRWYYQTVPHDLHDYDANSIPVLADVKIGGQTRKVVLFAPKSGYLYMVDRVTGKFLAAHPLVEGAKKWAEITPEGRPVVKKEDGTDCLADLHGGTNYWPPSFDPVQGLFFVTTHDVCQIYNTPQPGQTFSTIGSWTVGGAGYAALRALDPVSGKLKWEYRFPPSDFGLTGVSQMRSAFGIALSGGVTSTASGLIFSGDNEGNFIAFDSRTGKPLWHYQMGSPVWGSAAVTYMLDGKQHVLITAGLTLMDFAVN